MNHADRDSRADALLENLASERGGRLKVFLGAAPGVGKTFAMLNAARELRRQNVDVVVGLVETHGRVETEALIEGLEVLPRLQLDYKGRIVEEMDLDALLRRRPKVALVDELAHRNAPGSRHQRRYQDIEELLAAGIDVYTTVNIQHLESLNDQVMALTGVRVRETVPDTFLDRAGDVVLVDLPPRELIERLRQGKVYVPEQATSALASFFSPSNLTALRELAVQQVADRVDADLRDEMAARGLAPLPVRSRVLVAIDGLDNSEYLVRATRKLAERRQAPWTVVYVDTGRGGAVRTQGVESAFALARKLGADTTLLRGASVVDELLVYARRQAVSTIVIGRTRERPIARMFNQTLTQQLLQGGAHFELTILNTPYLRAQSRRRANAGEARRSLPEYALALLASGMATMIAALAERLVNLDDLSLVFITAVLIVAARTRMAVAVVTAALCFLAYNFFFIDPRYTFVIGASEGIATVLFFLAAALIAGRLASRLRGQVLSLRAANAHAGAMQALGRRLAVAGSDDEVLRAGGRSLRESLDADVVLLTVAAGTGSLRMAVSEPGSIVLDATARAAADWCAHHRLPAGRYTDTLNASAWWCLPLGGDGDNDSPGAVALRFDAGIDRLPPELRVLATSMIQDVADALSRACRAKPSACAPPCWPRCRTTCDRRWRRSSAAQKAWRCIANA
jgi:two-component system sensor histidine kinase KdpD